MLALQALQQVGTQRCLLVCVCSWVPAAGGGGAWNQIYGSTLVFTTAGAASIAAAGSPKGFTLCLYKE
jgi:hypothetical protein